MSLHHQVHINNSSLPWQMPASDKRDYIETAREILRGTFAQETPAQLPEEDPLLVEIHMGQEAVDIKQGKIHLPALVTRTIRVARDKGVIEQSITRMETGEVYTDSETLFEQAVRPLKILRAEDDDGRKSEYVKLRFETLSGSISEATVLAAALTNPKQHRQELAGMFDAGWSLTEQELRHAGKVFRDMLRHGQKSGAIEVHSGRARTGWTPDLSEHILSGHERYAGMGPIVHSKKGAATAWADVIREMVRESPVTGMVIGYGLGGYLRGQLRATDSHILHITGRTSMGKSLAARALASFIGQPDKGQAGIFFDAGSTAVGMETLLMTCTHGTLILDELHNLRARSKTPVEHLMYLTNRGGRGKGGKNGDLAQTKSWDVSMVSTGNLSISSLAEGHPQAEALSSRVIEIDVGAHPIWPWRDSQRAANYERVLVSHYGHGYAPVIQAILDNRAKYEGVFESVEKRISAAAVANHVARRGQAWGLLFAGIEVLRDVLDLDDASHAGVLRQAEAILGQELAQDEAAADPVQQAVELRHALTGFVCSNIGRFLVKGFYWAGNLESAQSNRAQELSNEAQRKGVWGVVEQPLTMTDEGELTGKIYIKSPSEALEKAAAAGVDIRALAEIAQSQGWLLQQGSTGGRGLLINKSGIGRCFGFDLTRARLHEQAAIKAALPPEEPWPMWAQGFRERWPALTHALERPTQELPAGWVVYLDETAAEITKLLKRAKGRKFSFVQLGYADGQLLIVHNGDAPASVLAYVGERWRGSATRCNRRAECALGMPFCKSTGPCDVPTCPRCPAETAPVDYEPGADDDDVVVVAAAVEPEADADDADEAFDRIFFQR